MTASQAVPGLGQHAAEDLLHLVELGLADDQRRGELDDRVAAVVGAAVEARLEQRRRQEAAQQPLGLLGVEGLLGRLVLDQLDPVEEPVAADVADDRQVQQLLQRRPERALRLAHVAAQVLGLHQVQVGQRDGGADRVAAEGVAVREARRPLQERLDHVVGGDHGADRGVAGGHPLRAGDHVRHVAELVAGERRPEPAERADDLVADQQDVVAVADLADPLEVAGGRGGGGGGGRGGGGGGGGGGGPGGGGGGGGGGGPRGGGGGGGGGRPPPPRARGGGGGPGGA